MTLALRTLVAGVVATAVLTAPYAQATPGVDSYTAAIEPSFVRAASNETYTATLATNPDSPDKANHATIAIPAGFHDVLNLSAAVTGGGCAYSSWTVNADSGSSIDLAAPTGGELCAGGTLTVNFDATAPASDNSYQWTTTLSHDAAAFQLDGTDGTVVVDGTAPLEPTIDNNPPALTNQTAATFEFSDSEADVGFSCQLDGAAFSPCSSPTPYTGLASGSHTFKVVAADAVGNQSTPASYTWTVDTVSPPITSIDSGPSDPSASTSATFVFSDTETAATFECRLDSGSFSSCNRPKSYSGLPDGGHTFGVRARDAAGNTSAEATYTWTVDTVDPVVTIASGPSPLTKETDATFTFSSNEAGSTFECKLDSGLFGLCTSPASYSNLADGGHTFRVRATDVAGNTGADATYNWAVDTVGPVATIGSGPPSPTNQTTANFNFSSSEPGSTFECRLDSQTFGSCTSPNAYSNLADGAHTFQVRATDPAGNTGAEAVYTWSIDTTPPVATITGPPALTNQTTATLNFSSEPSSTFECRLDAGSFAPCTSPKSYSSLADGGHAFHVRATDPAGNTGPEATYNWTVDTVGPAATISSGPSPVTNQTGATLSFSSEPGSTLECRLDGGAFASCTSPKSYSGLGDGPHTFRVRANDAVGNTGAEATYGWTVDTAAPVATIGSGPPSPTNQTSATFNFSSNEAGSTFECKLDSEAFAACTSPKTYSGLGDAAHTFRVRATDAAGNTGAEAIYTWTVDTVSPVVAIGTAPAALTKQTGATFTFSSNEAGSTLECRLDAASFASCTSPKTYSSLADGAHTFHVRATDPAGNTGTEAAYTWTVDTVSPVATIGSGPPSATDQTSATFTFSSNEPGSTFECRLDSGSFTLCTSPKTYSSLADGAHTFGVRATDPAGNTGTEATYSWTIDTLNPVVTITSGPAAATNQTSATFNFSSEPGSTFQCRLDSASFAACTSPKSYSALAEGVHNFRVQATDLADNTGPITTYTWTVDTTPPPAPTLTSKPDPLTNDPTPSFAFSAPEAGSTFSCKLDASPHAVCTSPIAYVAQSDGAHTFSVKATDAAGNTGPQATYTWTIDTTPPPAPTLTTFPPLVTASRSATFVFSSTDTSVSFDCRLNGAPFSACTPGPNEQDYNSLLDGAYTFRVRAHDAAGNVSTVTAYDWTVDTVAPTASLTSKPAALTNDSTPSFAFAASQAGSTFSCKLDAAAYAPCTSPITYPAQSDGQHTFSVKATDAAGNTGPQVSYSWTIDTVAPTVALTAKPAALTNNATPSFTFTGSETGGTFSCKLDQAAFAACTSPIAYAAQADGTHTFAVKATDAAGNAGPATSYSWTIDTIAPTATLTSTPALLSDDQTPTFAFSASEAGSTFACKLDAAVFSACTNPITYGVQIDGAHTFRIRATDAAGNTGVETTYTWTIDTAHPLVTISGPSTPTNQTSATFSFTSNKTGSTFECKLDAGAFVPCASPKTYSGLADGAHAFRVRATDPANNTGPEALYTWTVDTVAPPGPAIGGGPPAATNQTGATFVFSDGETVVGFSCRIDSATFAPCSSPKSYAGLADGPHTFAVRAQDAAGNPSSPSSYDWTVDTVAPDTAISSGPSLNSSSTTASFTFASNEEGASFACSLDGGAFSPCTSPQTYGGLADGAHTLAARAIDSAGNVDPTPAPYAWTVLTPRAPDTTPPGRVSRLTTAVGYGLARLSWRLPPDADLDHVSVFVATTKRGPLQTVYTGKGTKFAYKRFRNGAYYRFAVVSYDHAGNHSVQARVAVGPSALLRSPRDGAVVRRPPLLSWVAVRGATYYNIQLVYSGRKVLSVWPKRNQLQLRGSWRYHGAHRLKKGRYTWFAWPGFGARSAARYGQLLGQGSFVVR
jgi:hypothetical protein